MLYNIINKYQPNMTDEYREIEKKLLEQTPKIISEIKNHFKNNFKGYMEIESEYNSRNDLKKSLIDEINIFQNVEMKDDEFIVLVVDCFILTNYFNCYGLVYSERESKYIYDMKSIYVTYFCNDNKKYVKKLFEDNVCKKMNKKMNHDGIVMLNEFDFFKNIYFYKFGINDYIIFGQKIDSFELCKPFNAICYDEYDFDLKKNNLCWIIAMKKKKDERDKNNIIQKEQQNNIEKLKKILFSQQEQINMLIQKNVQIENILSSQQEQNNAFAEKIRKNQTRNNVVQKIQDEKLILFKNIIYTKFKSIYKFIVIAFIIIFFNTCYSIIF